MNSPAKINKNGRLHTALTETMPAADRNLFLFLLSLPVINAAADSTIYYFVETDAVAGLHPGIIRGAILIIFLMLFGVSRIRKNAASIVILVFLAYLFILTLLSSDFSFSFFSGYIKWFIPLLMFPVGLWFFRDLRPLLLLNRVYVWGAAIVCVNLLIAQFTDYGISAYVDKSFYTGGAGVGITNQLALVLLTYPLLLRRKDAYPAGEKWFIYAVGLVSLAFILIAMKRSGIISLLAGFLLYLYYTRSRVRFFRYLVVIILLFFIAFPVFKSVITPRYDARMKQMENIENEARYQEFFFVLREFADAGIDRKLFGTEVFNTGRFFGMKYFKTNRMIHSDMSSFFYGSGITGLLLYFGVFFFILREGARCRRRLSDSATGRELFAVYYGMLAATFLISLSGSGTIGERCLVFLFLGGLCGVGQAMIRSQMIIKLTAGGSVSSCV